uniref:Uncharacterized protein n=1 Tax=Rhinella marina erythrocytic-like virus TaxID=2859906 RepID=A0A8F6UAC7_9VIRU|nr:hypothetical protein RMELV036 [Rhinella marina erythrocytic-like virus]
MLCFTTRILFFHNKTDMMWINFCIHLGFTLGVILIISLVLYFMRNCIKSLLTICVIIILLAFAATTILVPPCILLSSIEDSNNTTYKFGIYVVNPEEKWSTMNVSIDKNCTFTNFYKDFTFISKLQ